MEQTKFVPIRIRRHRLDLNINRNSLFYRSGRAPGKSTVKRQYQAIIVPVTGDLDNDPQLRETKPGPTEPELEGVSNEACND